jgi:hypothetical protein
LCKIHNENPIMAKNKINIVANSPFIINYK